MALSSNRGYELPVATGGGEVRLAPRLRERYLTPQVETALVQASGTDLHIWLWSENCNICIALPLVEFRAEQPFTRSIHRWGINVNRWLDALDTTTNDRVAATVDTHQMPTPSEVQDE